MSGFDVDYDTVEPIDAASLARALESRDRFFHERIVQVMVLAELVLHPIPPEVAERVEEYADALGVHENLVRVARKYAAGSLGLAAFDLRRTGYLERWDDTAARPLHAKTPPDDPFDVVCHDAELYDRWAAFEALPPDSLGRKVWELYTERGFVFPGHPESAPPYLAQHDFVHVLADYSTRLEGEFEVFGMIGRADPDPRGFTWIATIIGLFETGYHDSQGLFVSNVSTRFLEEDERIATRLADAMYRGSRCGRDLLAVDYFELAHLPLDEVRHRLDIVGKTPEAVEAGSTSPFDPDWRNAMSEYQHEHGAAAAR